MEHIKIVTTESKWKQILNLSFLQSQNIDFISFLLIPKLSVPAGVWGQRGAFLICWSFYCLAKVTSTTDALFLLRSFIFSACNAEVWAREFRLNLFWFLSEALPPLPPPPPSTSFVALAASNVTTSRDMNITMTLAAVAWKQQPVRSFRCCFKCCLANSWMGALVH